jgi:hypothetical protein
MYANAVYRHSRQQMLEMYFSLIDVTTSPQSVCVDPWTTTSASHLSQAFRLRMKYSQGVGIKLANMRWHRYALSKEPCILFVASGPSQKLALNIHLEDLR